MATADEYAAWIVKNADKKGTPDFDVVAKAYQDAKATAVAAPAPEEPFGQRLNREIADIPRQIGLTARHGLNAVGSTVGMLSDPIGGAINAVVPGAHMQTARTLTDKAADMIGLPSPRNATERGVADATEVMGAGGGTIGLASKGANIATGGVKNALQTLASNPLQQTVSAGAAGGAGGYTRETGGDGTSQFVASLAAGVATPFAMNKLMQAGSSVGNAVRGKIAPPQELAAKVDIRIDSALQPSGMTMADLPAGVQNSIRADVQQAMKADGMLSPDAIRRLADYRLTGATPTAATLTLDPAMVSQQKNLAKLGINSKDRTAQQLGQTENANNRQLIGGLNDLGAGTPDNALAGGRKIINALADRNDAAKSAIGARYEAARASGGRSAELDPSTFTQTANNLLDEALLGGKLPSDVRNLLNKAAAGDLPLTVDVAEQFKTRIGDLQRSTTDMAERKALGLVRQALDNTPLLDGQGQQAIDAFNKARRLNRAWMGVVEKTPALQAVRDGIEPDKFVQQFIVGNGSKANVADLDALRRSVKSSPEALSAAKTQIAAYLKSSALNGAADEVGNFSQSAYNKALKAIGDEKLALFFQKDEVAQLKAIGRVASYEQFQPKGSAVNNSNTASAGLAAILDRVAGSPLLSKIPLGNMLAGPAQNISVGIQANRAMNVPGALVGNALARPSPPPGLLLSPAALMGSDREKKNSLFPGP
jgi:hypothetical protein